MNDEAQKAKTLERATQQLDVIEQMMTLLMNGIDIDDLKTSERLNIALKLMTQHTRILKLYDDISRDHGPSSIQQAFVGQLMHLMRNDSAEQEFDDSEAGSSSFSLKESN